MESQVMYFFSVILNLRISFVQISTVFTNHMQYLFVSKSMDATEKKEIQALDKLLSDGLEPGKDIILFKKMMNHLKNSDQVKLMLNSTKIRVLGPQTSEMDQMLNQLVGKKEVGGNLGTFENAQIFTGIFVNQEEKITFIREESQKNSKMTKGQRLLNNWTKSYLKQNMKQMNIGGRIMLVFPYSYFTSEEKMTQMLQYLNSILDEVDQDLPPIEIVFTSPPQDFKSDNFLCQQLTKVYQIAQKNPIYRKAWELWDSLKWNFKIYPEPLKNHQSQDQIYRRSLPVAYNSQNTQLSGQRSYLTPILLSSETTRKIYKQTTELSCDYLIKIIRKTFIQLSIAQPEKKNIQRFSRICQQFSKANQYQSTVDNIITLLRNIVAPLQVITQIYEKKMPGWQVIRFDRSFRQQYNSLGIEQLLRTKPKQGLSKDGSKYIIQGPFVEFTYQRQKIYDKQSKNEKSVQIRALFELSFPQMNAYAFTANTSMIAPMWGISQGAWIYLEDQKVQNGFSFLGIGVGQYCLENEIGCLYFISDGQAGGHPGILQSYFQREPSGQTQIQFNAQSIQKNSSILPTKPVGYQPIVSYQEFLFQFMNGKGVQKDIAYFFLKKFMTQDFVKKHRKTDSPYSKLDVESLIREMNLIVKIYNKFLFEQEFLTPEQMTDLVVGFKQKLAQFITEQFVQMNFDTQDVVRKIIANLVIIENSLKTTHAVLNFDYLNYFMSKTNASFEYKKLVQQHTKAKQQYETKLNQKIKQAESVTEEMQTQITKITNKIDEETKKLEKQMNEAQKQKQEYAKKLKKQLPWRILGKVFGFFSKVASFAGPKGQAVGKVLGVGQTLIDTLVKPPEPLSQKKLNPATYINMDNGLNDIKVQEVIRELRDIDPSLPSVDEIMKDIKFNNNIKKYAEYAQKGFEKAKSALQGMIEKKKKKKQQQNSKKPDTQKNKEEIETVKKKNKLFSLSNALKAATVANEGANTVKECFNAVDKVSQAQKDSAEFREMRLQLENFINNTMKNFMQKMRDINEVFSEAGSQARVLFLEYGFTATLNDILQHFKNTFKNTDFSNQGLYYLFTKLESATQSLSQIYGVIDNYKSQGELAQLIVDINKPLGDSLQKTFPGLNEMEDNFQKLVVYKEGNMILNSFKQSTFPRSPYYSYDAYYSIVNKDHTASIAEMMKQLKDVYHNHMLNKNMVGNAAQAFIIQDTEAVFYAFKEQYAITSMLKGQTVVIMPDVRLSPKERDAIKFTTINIRFELVPGATEEIKASFQRIQEKLESKGTVEMSSSGNYYYRYGQIYYNLPSAQLQLLRSYKPSGSISNVVFSLVSKGEPMFSPYTSWKLNINGIDFTDPIFQTDVDKCQSQLQLTFYGTAVYIDKSSFEAQASAKVPVHKCYKSFETKVFSILPKA